MRWAPSQYERFSDERLRPAIELLERVPLEAPRLVVDLGCGTGRVTRLIAARWPSARVCGLDGSADMLREARAQPSSITWIEGDVESWVPDEPPDLIYSNAALHWVEGHEELMPRLTRFVRPGGCVAVQMPLSFDLPSHRLMRETLEDGGGRGRPFGAEALRRAVARKGVAQGTVYFDLLVDHVAHLDVWETEYLHVLEGQDAVLEWVKGTGLRPILADLAGAERESFLDAYRRRLNVAYPSRPGGRTLYPFRRLFLVAVR